MHSIHLLHNKGIERYKREYVCRAITSGYFKVPQFRSIFLEAVKAKSISNQESNSKAGEKQSSGGLKLDVDEMVAACLLRMNEEEPTDDYFDWDKMCFEHMDPQDVQNNAKIIETIIQDRAT